MAILTIQFHSKQLKMNTRVQIVLPDSSKPKLSSISNYPVLYLLHGLSDDDNSWLRHTRVEDYALANGIIVVMPSGGRSAYCDNVYGQNYHQFISQELPQYLQWTLGLSTQRTKNFIAGNSMGGLGAAKIALTSPLQYAGFASFSGLIYLKLFLSQVTDELLNDFYFMKSAFDHPDTTTFDPINLVATESHDLHIYLACGYQDDLLACTQAFYEKAKHYPITCIIEDGKHDWEFWDKHIKKYLEYLYAKTND